MRKVSWIIGKSFLAISTFVLINSSHLRNLFNRLLSTFKHRWITNVNVMHFIYFHACFSSKECCGGRVHDFSVWPILSEPFRSESFRSQDVSVLVVPVSRHFGQAMKSCRNLIQYVHFLMQAYLNQRKVLFKKKLQSWFKIQQLISMNVWFSLSSASKSNDYRNFQLNTNT